MQQEEEGGKREERKQGKAEAVDGELVLMAHGATEQSKIEEDIWIADSGASMHATHSKHDMFDVSPCNVKITIGDSNDLKATYKGKKRLFNPTAKRFLSLSKKCITSLAFIVIFLALHLPCHVELSWEMKVCISP